MLPIDSAIHVFFHLQIDLLLHGRHLICEEEAALHVAELLEMRLMQSKSDSMELAGGS